MSTRLQGALLGELVLLVPDNSQLWIATHSIGMMHKARALYDVAPASVAFLDFSEREFDVATTIEPVEPTRTFWRRVLSVALADLADLVVPKTIVICEGNPTTPRPRTDEEHDAVCYRTIFGEQMSDVEFVSAGNSSDVQTDRLAIMSSIKKIAGGVTVIPLIDRDDHSDADVRSFESKGYRLLSRRHIESYLYDDEVLDALCDSVGKPEEKQAIRQVKAAAIAASVGKGKPANDIKNAAGEIFVGIRRRLGLTSMGNTERAFARNTLCPLVLPSTHIYAELKRAIFG